MTSYLPLVQSVPVASSVWENVYAEESNMRHARTPVINSQVNKIDLNSKSMTGGAQIQVELPQGPLLSHCMLVLKIDKTKVPAGCYLRKGWGYRFIRNYETRTGGQTNLRTYGRQLQMRAICDCETLEKRERMLELGGAEYLGSPASIKGKYIIAYVHIYLPWSNLNAGKFLPYDTGVLNKPISLMFEFESADKVFTYAAENAGAIKSVLPTEFVANYLMCQTSLMALGSGESIRPEVGPLGTSQYSYPYVYSSAFVSSEFDGVPEGQGLQKVRLEQFSNGSVQSIDLFLERKTLGDSAQTRISDCPNNDIHYEDMKNIEVKYGGQVIYRSDDESNKLMALSEYTTSNTFNSDYPNMAPSGVNLTAPFTTNTSTGTWVHIQLTQFNDNNGLFKNMLQDGCSLVNNMLEVSFNTPDQDELSNGSTDGTPNPAPVAITTEPKYVLHASYNYQVCLNTFKGFTDTMFLPANSQGPYTMAS